MRAPSTPTPDTRSALQDLRRSVVGRRTEERRSTNRELLDVALHAPTPVERSRAADTLRRQIRSLCAALIDQKASTLTAHEVDDLTQEVLLRLLQSRTAQSIDPTPAYLSRIATNVLIDHLRFCKRRGLTAPAVCWEDTGGATTLADVRVCVEAEVLDRIRNDEIRAELQRALKPVEADVLWLRAEGASHGEIARDLGMGEANARKHCERGLKRLQRLALLGTLTL